MSALKDSLLDINNWRHLPPGNNLAILPNPVPHHHPISLPVNTVVGPAVPASIMVHSFIVKLTFQGDIWITNAEAKTGYTSVTASNGHVKWDTSSNDLPSPKLVCFWVARSNMMGKPLKLLFSISKSGSIVQGGWTFWISNSRAFPKTNWIQVNLSVENIQAWLKEVYTSNQEAGVLYRGYQPSKLHKEANVVSNLVGLRLSSSL